MTAGLRRMAAVVFVAYLAGVLPACSGGHGSLNFITARVGAAGGTVIFPGGRLVVPAGAFEQAVTFHIRRGGALPLGAAQGLVDLVGERVSIDGAQSAPLHPLELDLSPGPMPAGASLAQLITLTAEPGGPLGAVESRWDPASGVVRATLPHLSIFGLALPNPATILGRVADQFNKLVADVTTLRSPKPSCEGQPAASPHGAIQLAPGSWQDSDPDVWVCLTPGSDADHVRLQATDNRPEPFTFGLPAGSSLTMSPLQRIDRLSGFTQAVLRGLYDFETSYQATRRQFVVPGGDATLNLPIASLPTTVDFYADGGLALSLAGEFTVGFVLDVFGVNGWLKVLSDINGTKDCLISGLDALGSASGTNEEVFSSDLKLGLSCATHLADAAGTALSTIGKSLLSVIVDIVTNGVSVVFGLLNEAARTILNHHHFPVTVTPATGAALAFTTQEGVWIKTGDGQPQRIAGGMKEIIDLIWSADGQRLAWFGDDGTASRSGSVFLSDRQGNVHQWACICHGVAFLAGELRSVSTDGAQLLTFAAGTSPTQSPLRGVTFRPQRPGGSTFVNVVNASGSSEGLVLAAPTSDCCSAYGGPSTLYTVDARSNVQALFDDPGNVGIGYGVIAPDRKSFAYIGQGHGGACANFSYVAIARMGGGPPLKLPMPTKDRPWYVVALAWRPEGTLLATLVESPDCASAPRSGRTVGIATAYELKGTGWLAGESAVLEEAFDAVGTAAMVQGSVTADAVGVVGPTAGTLLLRDVSGSVIKLAAGVENVSLAPA